MEKSVQFSNRQSAILLIEFQKTYTEKALFHRLIKKQFESRKVLENTLNLLSAARKKDITIIQAPLILHKTDKHKSPHLIFARLLKAFKKGTWKVEFPDGIHYATDIVIRGRSSVDACAGSDLLEKLNENNIKKLYVCGFITNGCVKITMESLIDKGFECIMISDCTATGNEKSQRKTEQLFQNITSKQLIDVIQ